MTIESGYLYVSKGVSGDENPYLFHLGIADGITHVLVFADSFPSGIDKAVAFLSEKGLEDLAARLRDCGEELQMAEQDAAFRGQRTLVCKK